MAKKFCIVPWQELYNTSIGTFRMCCDEEDNDVTQYNQTPIDQGVDAHWNSEYMKNSRKIFLSDELHPSCGRCWNDEDNGKISLRMRRNQKYLGLDDSNIDSIIAKINTITMPDGTVSTGEITAVNLSVGNVCQLRCTHCSPAYSNNVGKEYVRLGWEDKENSRKFIFIDKYLGAPKQKNFDNDFWPLIQNISQNLKFINVTGGEPLISKGFYNFLRYLDRENLSKNINIQVSTNAVSINDECIDLLGRFDNTSIRISTDASGDLENYTRYPTDWSRKLENIRKIKSKIENVVLFTTIYALNICGFKEFLDETKDLVVQRDIGILSWPREFDIRHMPDEIKQKLSRDFVKIISKKDDFLLENGLKSIVRRLSMDRDPEQWNKAVKIIQQYDTVRPKSLKDICPDLSPYL